ncbi:MAG: type II toxin-antitoxin system HicB family antitoxin [Proteobacteria bacterium]|nr:type II toxin-antitoxin system HicB family antitoxin [Pseudomonadota bacterium]
MHDFSYPVQVRKDKGGRYLVRFPDIPFAITDGATRDEALEEAVDCLEEALAELIINSEEIPVPSPIKRVTTSVAPPAKMAIKVALYITMREQQSTKSALARRLKIDVREVRRMCDPYYGSKLPRMEEAIKSLGAEIVISLKSAA